MQDSREEKVEKAIVGEKDLVHGDMAQPCQALIADQPEAPNARNPPNPRFFRDGCHVAPHEALTALQSEHTPSQ